MFKNKAKSRRFVLARSSDRTILALVKRRYQRNFEKALILSLIAAIVGVRFLSMVHVERLLFREDQLKLEYLNIIDIPPPIEEKPKMKMEEVVEIPPEETTSEESPVEKEIEELLEEKEEVQLALNSNSVGDLLVTSSQLGAIAGPELNFRKTRTDVGGSIVLKNRKFYSDDLAGGLEIGKVEGSNRKLTNENIGLDLKTKPVDLKRNKPEANAKTEPKLGIHDVPERIISFSSSTFGTEDYKLWNKINAELDRLNKGRYGSVPKEITRVRGGFLIRFSFPDGTRQEIHWENSGNVWIKISGKSNLSSVQELRRALDSLLKITLGS